MEITSWIKSPVESILDVGCNVGAWLSYCSQLYPYAQLAGIEINQSAIAVAKRNVPTADLHFASAERIPFSNESFNIVTCLEVLEHLPANLRSLAFQEMHRVLRPSGRLILTVPHAGWFAWLDSNNVRLLLPGLYSLLIQKGMRDGNYINMGREVEWHKHFTKSELIQVAGKGWNVLDVSYGGLFLAPLMDWLSYPFYRIGLSDHPVRQMFGRIAALEYRQGFGSASYGIMLVMEKASLE